MHKVEKSWISIHSYQRGKTFQESEVKTMNDKTVTEAAASTDDELIDVLIAISVVAKRLANKLKMENYEVNEHGRQTTNP